MDPRLNLGVYLSSLSLGQPSSPPFPPTLSLSLTSDATLVDSNTVAESLDHLIPALRKFYLDQIKLTLTPVQEKFTLQAYLHLKNC